MWISMEERMRFILNSDETSNEFFQNKNNLRK